MVNSPPVMVVAFESVTMNQPDLGVLIDGNSSTSFSAEAALVLCTHDLLTKVALIDVKVG